MKKYSLPFIAITALALAGCAREQSLEEDGIKMVIEAVMAENNTKTIIQDGTTSVLWEAGDEIKVFFDGTGGRFANQYTEPSATARFSGTLNVVFASNEGFSDATPLWGLYPYRTDATADNASVTTTLPASQIGRADSFAKNTLITLGKSTSLSMGFYNVCGGIRFSLTQEGIKEVVFQGLNDENIAGKVRLAFEDGLPAVQEVIESEKTITLTAPGNATFETGCWYYIVALPGTLSNGFRMTFNTATQYATLESSGSKTVKRGIFGSLANADEGLVFEDKEDSGVEDGNIVFADPAAKYACVAKYDTDGDGEVSIEEAEAATSFEGLFTNWRGVTSFDEIKYFKNVHSLSGAFYGCTKLISLTVPENITDLGELAFMYCFSLTSIILPSGITRIGQSAFEGCSSLSSINIPSNVTAIDANAFSRCSSLESIDFPSNLESIGDSAFSECSSLTDIVIPDSVTSIGKRAFASCSNLTSVHLPSGITSIPFKCFDQCSALTTVSIPDGVTSIGERAFEELRMWKLELPSSISSLGEHCFGNNSNIICVLLPSTSPVTIEPGAFYGVQRIYVPSNLIDMYSVMTNWSFYASLLLPIDSYSDPDPDYSGPVEGTSEWSLVGSLLYTNWDTDWVAAKDGDIYVVKNVWLTPGDQFKFRKDKNWDENRGAVGDVGPFVLTTGESQAVVHNGTNLSVAADGIYDIYYNAAMEQMAVCEPDKTPNWKVPASFITIDGDFSDWAALPAGSFSEAYGDEDAIRPALTHCKVYANEDYIYVYFEWDTEYTEPIPDVDHVPFHCFINTDGNTATGGYSNLFADACTDVLLEGFLYDDGVMGSYNPISFSWAGEPNGGGWNWGYFGAKGLCEGAGIEGKYEFKIDRSVLADFGFPVADVFSIGFDIEKNWDAVGILPNEAPSEENPSGVVNSLTVVTQR